MMTTRIALIACAFTLAFRTSSPTRLPPLSCNTFAAARSVASLQKALGSPDVAADSVPLGEAEGDMVPATIFFPTIPARRVEVAWHEGNPERGPRYVRLRVASTEWQTTEGVSIGTSLHELERLNGRPFRLAGFGFDYSATVTSWERGRLRPYTDGPCELVLRLDSLAPLTERQKPLYHQVMGDRTFSSGHPAMQALNPRVAEMFLMFP